MGNIDNMNLTWKESKFSDLSVEELYKILALRQEVFVVEQTCIYQDIDFLDQKAIHLLGMDTEKDKLASYCRVFLPGVYVKEPVIGRVIVNPDYRKGGLGKELMLKAISLIEETVGKTEIRIGAQYYLKNFYGSLGFEQTGEIYDEDGIDHIPMVRPAS